MNLTQQEYLLLKSVSLKHNKYYVANIRLQTKKAILNAIRLKLKITEHDTIMNTSKTFYE